MATLRLVGDVHGDYQALNELTQSCQFYDLTIQIGDFGIGFGAEKFLDRVSSDRLRVLHGNHDNWNILKQYPHDLGRFGVFEFAGKQIFFVAGAWSIDHALRTPGYDWWSCEELSYEEADQCLTLWEKVCNDIDLVITHDAPPNVGYHILKAFPTDTHTGRLLWEMFKIHNPPAWRFGHWHKKFQKTIGTTDFRCIDINESEVLEW